MKHLPLVAAAALALGLASCSSSAQSRNHWHVEHVGSSIGHAFFGTVPDSWSVFEEEFRGGVGHVSTTLSRHFMNVNPGNPLQPQSRNTSPDYPQPPDREFTVGD